MDNTLKRNPKHMDAWNISGNCHYYLGETEESMACYEAMLGIDSTYPKAWYNKGVVLSDIRLYNEAIRCYEEVAHQPGHGAWYGPIKAIASPC